jgi:hypothetical protein
MTDNKDTMGPDEAARGKGGATADQLDENAEGHGMRGGRGATDDPSMSPDEGNRFGKATDDATDTEGHAARGGKGATDDPSMNPDEIYRPGRATDDPSAEAEGHGLRRGTSATDDPSMNPDDVQPDPEDPSMSPDGGLRRGTS